MTTTTTGIRFHTEATYTVDLRNPEHAKPITTQEGDFQPDFLSLSFTCALNDRANATPWKAKVSTSGPWLDRRASPARCTYLPWGEFIPDWILPHLEQHSPHHIALRSDGPATSDQERPELTLLLGPRDTSASPQEPHITASIRHSVWSEHLQCDELIEIPGAHPGTQPCWIKPDSISVTFQWQSHLSSLGGDWWQHWTLADLSITGANLSNPDQSAEAAPSRRLRAPLGIRPKWAQEFINEHKPLHIYLHRTA